MGLVKVEKKSPRNFIKFFLSLFISEITSAPTSGRKIIVVKKCF